MDFLKEIVKEIGDEYTQIASDIDETRAEEAKKRAEKRLENKNDPSIDEERAKLALFRAINRLELIEYR